jgi:ribosome-associated translation inhibitor RaiA
MNAEPSAARRDLNIELKASKDVPEDQVEAVRRRVSKLERYMKKPPAGALRVTVRKLGGRPSGLEYVLDADVRFEGRTIAAHVAGHTADEAADELVTRLREQIRGVVGREVAQRNEPAAIRRALESLPYRREYRPQKKVKPPEQRRIVHWRTYSRTPKTTLDAVRQLLDFDYEFLAFRHARTEEDVVVYRRDDGRLGLIHPQGSPLAGENTLVEPEPSRYPAPIKFDDARADMDELDLRFLYFVDLDDGRGKVLYLRHDGDYGVVEPG